jgi:preprotein translocase subunit SecG
METFVTVLHIVVALILISLVLLQDSKGGAGGAFGGGGSQSVLGAVGATTLAQKLTRWTAVAFAGTCIALSIFSSKTGKSVIDNAVIPPAPVQEAAAPSADTSASPASTTIPPK